MNKLSVEEWKEFLQYDPELGVFTWIKLPTNRVKESGESVFVTRDVARARRNYSKFKDESK